MAHGPGATAPKMERHADAIDAAVGRLYGRLMTDGLEQYGLSDYSTRYLGESLGQGPGVLRIFARILSIGLQSAPADLSHVTVVDHGGGNGLLSLIAREIGVGRVVFNDIYDVSCVDARRLGSALGLEADAYVHGDTDDLIPVVREPTCDLMVLCSYDVVEHLYDVDAFIRDLPRFSGGNLVTVMASSANILNARRRRRLMAIQRDVETNDRIEIKGHNQRDTLRAYRSVRAAMIRERAANLSDTDVAELARRTRGMARWDIEAATDRFLRAGEKPPEPSHPTNTCDPYTGNWTERLIDPRVLAIRLAESGFKARVESGFYPHYAGPKGVIARVINGAIRLGGIQGLRLAPYYILVGERH